MPHDDDPLDLVAPPHDDRYLSRAESAGYINSSEWTIDSYARQGKLTRYRFPSPTRPDELSRRVFFLRSELDRLAQREPLGAPQPSTAPRDQSGRFTPRRPKSGRRS